MANYFKTFLYLHCLFVLSFTILDPLLTSFCWNLSKIHPGMKDGYLKYFYLLFFKEGRSQYATVKIIYFIFKIASMPWPIK